MTSPLAALERAENLIIERLAVGETPLDSEVSRCLRAIRGARAEILRQAADAARPSRCECDPEDDEFPCQCCGAKAGERCRHHA